VETALGAARRARAALRWADEAATVTPVPPATPVTPPAVAAMTGSDIDA
jgi:hypothetical protein